jgi:hypothetical protein
MPKSRNLLYLLLILIVTVIIIAVFLIVKNENADEGRSLAQLTDPHLIEGKRLSEQYCSACHVYPDPDLLPASTWMNETLPAMGPFMGIYEHQGEHYSYPANPSQTRHLPPGYYPDEPLLSNEAWQKILDYYEFASPDILPPSPREPEIISDSLFFTPHFPEFESDQVPQVTMIKFDPETDAIYFSDANRFNIINRELKLNTLVELDSPITGLQLLNDSNTSERKMLLTHIGNYNPSDEPVGMASQGWYNPASGEANLISEIIIENLTRPVDSQFTDLTGNGHQDLLIAEFGHRTGRLSWLENTGTGFHPEKNVLIETPGCIQSYALDVTGNGLNDIFTLCTQLDQSIYLFKNNGDGHFEKKKLIQFKITAGSSSFELFDINDNGHLDIIYTSGDNADYSKVYKPYHGIYIFINDGEFNFTKEWFYPVNGAYNVAVRDFNKNGLPDLAVISYFADFMRTPEEGFIFFKNSGDLEFIPYHHPATQTGRWITMDVADWTGNGYDDIILGNSPFGPDLGIDPFRHNWSHNYPFILLENRMIR